MTCSSDLRCRAWLVAPTVLGLLLFQGCNLRCPAPAMPRFGWVETPVGAVDIPSGWSTRLLSTPSPSFVLYSPSGDVEVHVQTVPHDMGNGDYEQALNSRIKDVGPAGFHLSPLDATTSYGEIEVSPGMLFAICAKIADPHVGRPILAIAVRFRTGSVPIEAYREAGGQTLLCSLAASASSLKDTW